MLRADITELITAITIGLSEPTDQACQHVSGGGPDDAEPVMGGVLDQDGNEFPGWVGAVTVIGLPNDPGHHRRRNIWEPH